MAYDPLATLTELYGEDLAIEQLRLEAEAYTIGEKRFHDAMLYKAEAGQSADTQVARPLIAELVPKLSTKFAEFLTSQQTGRPGKKAASFKHLRELDTDRVAYISIRCALNILTREASIQRVTKQIGMEIEDESRFSRIRELDKKSIQGFDNQIKKRSADHFKRAYARAVEKSLEETGDMAKWDSWSVADQIAVGLKAVELMIEIGLVVLHNEINEADRTKDSKEVRLSDEAVQWMAQRSDFLAGVSPRWTAMVVPPKPWTALNRGGYWGRGRSNPKLLKGTPRRIQKRYDDVDMSRVFNAVNAIQRTPWMVNPKVLAVAQKMAEWDNPLADIPKADPEALPDRLDGMDEDAKVLKQWKRSAAKVYRRERARQSRRLNVESIIKEATKLADYERIWFPYNLDFRSRIYAIPAFSPQGSDLSKGLLMLADASPMGDDGEYWLRMHIANVAGLDKEPMDVRQKWTYDNEALILATAADPLDNLWWATDSDSPFCFLAACFEYAHWKASHNPKEYRCGLPIAFDGSCSGIQHFSAMLRDESGGKAVNLIPAERPSDIYRIVSDKVQLVVNKDLLSGTDSEQMVTTDEESGEIREWVKYGTKVIAKWWDDYGITRSVTKRSVMTLPYGSKEYGFVDQLLEDIVMPAVDKHGEHVFPNPRAAAAYMAKLIWNALGTTVVAAVEAMHWLQKAAGALVTDNMPIHWVTPAGFPVWQENIMPSTKRVDTIICGSIRLQMVVHSTHGPVDKPEDSPEDNPVDNYTRKIDRHASVNGISPNFIHSMDASHMMLTALAAQAQGVEHFAMIHDSFGTCPGNAGTMFRVVRETMVKTYTERDVMQEFYEGFCNGLTEKSADKIPELPSKGTLDLEGILKSKYCFA